LWEKQKDISLELVHKKINQELIMRNEVKKPMELRQWGVLKTCHSGNDKAHHFVCCCVEDCFKENGVSKPVKTLLQNPHKRCCRLT
jgi:hypothetical protein